MLHATAVTTATMTKLIFMTRNNRNENSTKIEHGTNYNAAFLERLILIFQQLIIIVLGRQYIAFIHALIYNIL